MPDISRRIAMEKTTHGWQIDKIEWLNDLGDEKINKLRGTIKTNSKRLKREIQK